MSHRNLEIERLRAIAALLVILVHSPFKQLFSPYLYSSFTGVDLFFVISGFVVSRSFLRTLPNTIELDLKSRLLHNKQHIVSFYLRRIFRIMPSAMFFALLYLLVSILMKATGSISDFARPGNVFREIVAVGSSFYDYAWAAGTVTSNLAPYWSLSIEEHFYLIAPILLILCATNFQRVAVLMSAVLVVLLVFRPLTSASIPNLSHTRFDSLFYGMLLSVLFEQYRNLGFWNFKALNRDGRVAGNSLIARLLCSDPVRPVLKTAVGFSLCAILTLLPGVTNTAIVGGSGNFNNSSAGLLAYAFISVLLVMLASLDRGWILEIPVLKRVLEYLGARSYAIYLSHWLFILIYNDLFFRFYEQIPDFMKLTTAGYGIQFAGYLAVVVLVSEASYRLIESPFINMGKEFIGALKEVKA